jgi:hypothetical protein
VKINLNLPDESLLPKNEKNLKSGNSTMALLFECDRIQSEMILPENEKNLKSGNKVDYYEDNIETTVP